MTLSRTTILSRFLIAIVLTLAISVGAKAQTRIPRELHVGVIGGVNMSDYAFHPAVSTKMVNSYTGGVAVRYIEETFFGLQAELLLTERAFSDRYQEESGLEFTRKFTYIELPVMAHVYFPIGSHNEVAFDAGPKLGWYLSDSSTGNLPDNFGHPGSEYANYKYLHHELGVKRAFDYGIQAGLGYEFKFNQKMSLQVQGRYYYGLGNLWPDTKADDFEQSSNQSIQIVMSLWWHHTIRGKKVKRPTF